VNTLLNVEKMLERLLAKHIGFRVLIAIEKKRVSSQNNISVKTPSAIPA